ncbi:hypothetical protein HN51_015506 [Arachis hypogaea]|uniref:TMV resistance protein N n=1 Tax=Arachis hypogaea TaxID=3818 RepID=UPI000DEC628D|nr:TMV resistance protein N isoform X1 [Arachis hypogaea]QHO45972.1 TMV resistance protein N [Arachis hypogaea]
MAISTRWTNHVFLSFRGDDTRKGFTDHLFASLERRGIKTFKDDHDLDKGGSISVGLFKAIEESMFALIILSPNYASSTWCLDELQKILHCRSNLGQAVFPIFYGVDPSDVRYQRETFGEAFRKHEERFREDKDKVKRWRDALREVASFSGWDSKDQHEAGLVETIVDHIQKMLIPKLPTCTDNLVGVDSRIKRVISLIGMRLDDVRFVGIWGMGGIGKTTTARLVYESIKEEFQVSCFLQNIREMHEKNGLVQIQKELLSHLNVRSSNFHNFFDGKKIIANSLRNKKVLLVLDDVSELSQLENLAEKQEWFGPGSKVIITTRDKHILATHGVLKTCEIGGLFSNEALHLLSLKAFKQDEPKEGYLDLCKEVVEYTKGLPLAIEVLGSHLHGRTIEVWHSALKQIRSFPLPEIQNTLKVSYDGLNSPEQDMFLDIACFFKGMDKEEVTDMLETCGGCPKIGIEILIERNLITISATNKLQMHDLIQEMGRNIVFLESPNDPGKRSRLWSQDDIDHVLTNNKGTEAIQAIVLDIVQPYEACWSTEAFSNTNQVRLLKLCEMQLPLGLNCLPCSLKVLHWEGSPLKTLPFSNQLNELVDLNLSHSKIEQLWHGKKILKKLRFINLSFSKNLKKTLDFDGVPNLESLVLEGCTSLTEIHTSLVHHKKLVLLNLKDCKRLKAFPSKLEMCSLKDLNLSGCSELKILPEFGENMELLSMLSLEGTAITKLPSSVGSLVGLTQLKLNNCKNLVCLPDTIHKLKSLKILNVSGCSKIRSLPECLKEIKCLEELCASETAIEELPSCVFYLESLRVISFAGCKGQVSNSMEMFLPFKWLFGSQQAPTGFRLPPSVSRLCLLSSVDLSYCNLSDESIPDDFCHLSSLRILDLSGNDFVSMPSSISKLPKLEYLDINWCKKLESLPELPSSIKELDASNCASLEASKLNLSKPCNLFASPIQCHLPIQEIINRLFEGLSIPKARFDMLITGSEIPSWFVPQRCISFAKIAIPQNCPVNDWVGFALCFMLVSYADPPQVCNHEVDCYLFGPKGKMLINSRNLPLMEPYCPHLYILYLSIDKFRHTIYEGGHFKEIEFVLKSYCCHSLQIVRCGSRLVCKQDVEDIFGNHS